MTCVFICPQDASVVVHNPPNTQSVELYFRGEKMAKVLNVSIIKTKQISELCGQSSSIFDWILSTITKEV